MSLIKNVLSIPGTHIEVLKKLEISQGKSIDSPEEENREDHYSKKLSCRNNSKWSIHKNRKCP